jgi:DUF971 family protein/molybdopterin converting factor small subunit
MNEESSKHYAPTEINLHAKSRLMSISFEDGSRFELPCEYLRVFSKAATLDASILGKEGVNIERIEPQGQYAIRIVFDDGHDTGIYSWDTLYSLGANRQANWAEYLKHLEGLGYQRQEPEGAAKRVRLLYFSWLAKKLRKESEEVTLPATITTVQNLLTWLGQRRKGAEVLFTADRLRATVNRQFAEGFTKLREGDEIGLVPNSPTPPATPDLV